MRCAPYCTPIFLGGSLQYFADVRAANAKSSSVSSRRLGFIDRDTVFTGPIDQLFDCPPSRSPGASFNLDAYFKSGEGT